MSDWVSFADYLGLNGDEVKRLQDEAFQRAQGTSQEASMDLQRATAEAGAEGDATQTASYGDYVKAQQSAAAQARAATANSGYADAYENAARGMAAPQAESMVNGFNQNYGRAAASGYAQNKRKTAEQTARDNYNKGIRESQAATAAELEKRRTGTAAYNPDVKYSSAIKQGNAPTSAQDYANYSDAVRGSSERRGGIGAGTYYDDSEG